MSPLFSTHVSFHLYSPQWTRSFSPVVPEYRGRMATLIPPRTTSTTSQILRYQLVTSPPPCFAHQCQNKGVRSVDLGMNIKTKDLPPIEKIWADKSFVLIFLHAPCVPSDFAGRACVAFVAPPFTGGIFVSPSLAVILEEMRPGSPKDLLSSLLLNLLMNWVTYRCSTAAQMAGCPRLNNYGFERFLQLCVSG
jgi:hypothetical protein